MSNLEECRRLGSSQKESSKDGTGGGCHLAPVRPQRKVLVTLSPEFVSQKTLEESLEGVVALWTLTLWWTANSLSVEGLLEPFLPAFNGSFNQWTQDSLPGRLSQVLALEFPSESRFLLLTNENEVFVSDPLATIHSKEFWKQLNGLSSIVKSSMTQMAVSDTELCILESNGTLHILCLDSVIKNSFQDVSRSQSGLFFTKIVAGASHFLGLSSTGDVWASGSHLHGQLGIGGNAKVTTFYTDWIQVEALAGLKIVGIAAGGLHSVFLSESGDVYTVGSNKDGQLGISTAIKELSSNSTLPWGIPWPVFEVSMDIQKSTKVGIAAGSRHTLVWSNGVLYASGDFKYSEMKTKSGFMKSESFEEICIPSYYNTGRSKNVERAWAGAWTSVLLLEPSDNTTK